MVWNWLITEQHLYITHLLERLEDGGCTPIGSPYRTCCSDVSRKTCWGSLFPGGYVCTWMNGESLSATCCNYTQTSTMATSYTQWTWNKDSANHTVFLINRIHTSSSVRILLPLLRGKDCGGLVSESIASNLRDYVRFFYRSGFWHSHQAASQYNGCVVCTPASKKHVGCGNTTSAQSAKASIREVLSCKKGRVWNPPEPTLISLVPKSQGEREKSAR